MATTSLLLLNQISLRPSRGTLRSAIGVALLTTALLGFQKLQAVEPPSKLIPATTFTMNDSAPSGYNYHVISPAGREFLTCRFLCPDDFASAELPAIDFDPQKTMQFLPLSVVIAKYGAIVFSVGARPAYEDGTVSEWLAYIVKEEGYEAGPVEEIKIGRLTGAVCDAIQMADGVAMRMRIVLIENGGRLFNLGAMAPAPLWSAAAEKLERMLNSFELAEDQGARVAIKPGQPVPTSEAPAAVATTSDSINEKPASHHRQAAPNSEEMVGGDDSEPKKEPFRLNAKEWAELVLAEDASAVDPEQKINANLRDRGVGMVPNVVEIDEAAKVIRVAAGAIESIFRVPFGWHVIDDGRRTLVFDAGGRMQISANLRRWSGTPMELGMNLISEYQQAQPDIPVITHQEGEVTLVAVRRVQIEGEVLEQGFLIRPRGDGVMLVARATAEEKDIRLALNLAGDIVDHAQPLEMAAAR